MTPQALGLDAEKRVAQKLAVMGFSVRRMKHPSPFDLLVDDKRVEVKCARPSDKWEWVINFHRHGKLAEHPVDVYVVLLDGVPGNKKMPIYLVFSAPIKRTVMNFRFASLLRKYSQHIDNWQLLGTPSRKGVAA